MVRSAEISVVRKSVKRTVNLNARENMSLENEVCLKKACRRIFGFPMTKFGYRAKDRKKYELRAVHTMESLAGRIRHCRNLAERHPNKHKLQKDLQDTVTTFKIGQHVLEKFATDVSERTKNEEQLIKAYDVRIEPKRKIRKAEAEQRAQAHRAQLTDFSYLNANQA